jgi:hypothetical protein
VIYLNTATYFGAATVFVYALCWLIAWTWRKQRDTVGTIRPIGWTALRIAVGCGVLVPLLLFDNWFGDFRQNQVYSWYVVGLFVLSLIPGSIFLIRKRAALENEEGLR